MNIHLVNDEKFIKLSVSRFEHYYPGKNIFFVEMTKGFNGKFKHIEPHDKIIPLDLRSQQAIKTILSYCNGKDHLFIHYLTENKSPLVNKLKNQINVKTYWIFHGADLYSLLNSKGLYELYDYYTPGQRFIRFVKKQMFNFRILPYSIKEKEKCIEQLNYFCFWNHFDYHLLIQKLTTKAKFKFFRYYEVPVEDIDEPIKEKGSILVNHSSSRTGNHLTILKALRDLDQKKAIKKLYTPLGYPNEQVKKRVIDFGNHHLSYCFEPIISFMPKIEYHNYLKKIEVAVFGHLRQEGGGNIFYLLATGCKVFLRKGNNLCEYLKERGYYIFDFESGLKSMDDLRPLDLDMQNHNRSLVLEEFSKEKIDKTYKNLIS